MPQLDREGKFRGEPAGSDVKKFPSGSVSIWIKFKVLEMLIDGQWQDWSQYDQDVSGDFWVVGKDGQLKTENCQRLMEVFDWDGDLEKWLPEYEGDWVPNNCQITVRAETNDQGNTYFNAQFVDPYDAKGPAGTSKYHAGADDVKSIIASHGAKLKALAKARKGSAKKADDEPPI